MCERAAPIYGAIYLIVWLVQHTDTTLRDHQVQGKSAASFPRLQTPLSSNSVLSPKDGHHLPTAYSRYVYHSHFRPIPDPHHLLVFRGSTTHGPYAKLTVLNSSHACLFMSVYTLPITAWLTSCHRDCTVHKL